MTNEYEWVDSSENPQRQFGSSDVLFGWIVYAAALLFLIV